MYLWLLVWFILKLKLSKFFKNSTSINLHLAPKFSIQNEMLLNSSIYERFYYDSLKCKLCAHTSLDRRKDTRRQKRKQSFQTKIMKSKIHCHKRNKYEMKAEFLTFQSTYDSLHTNIHEQRNINFKRRRKFDGTSDFSAIQTSVLCHGAASCDSERSKWEHFKNQKKYHY